MGASALLTLATSICSLGFKKVKVNGVFDLLAVREQQRKVKVYTLVQIFPEARQVVEINQGRLFFGKTLVHLDDVTLRFCRDSLRLLNKTR